MVLPLVTRQSLVPKFPNRLRFSAIPPRVLKSEKVFGKTELGTLKHRNVPFAIESLEVMKQQVLIKNPSIP